MIDDDSPRSRRPRSGSSRSRRRRAPEGKAIETTTNEEYLAGLSSAADLFEGEAPTPQEESHGRRRRRHGVPVGVYDRFSKGSRAYHALTKEIIERIEG